ncbi:Trehalase [Cytospora mali]|uniref:Trehalase n=1 Tax=Cytospora mali TaxID=578113 RepID=A0A194VA78_CYTMA|nr:Trehalase [Valsa mali var. pyri (nom. inval.)]
MTLLIGLVTAVVASDANSTGIDGIFYNGSDIAPCSSPLYCYGPIIGSIQLAKPFKDSKTYVDMPTKAPLEQVLAGYDNLTKPLHNGTELLEFLSTYFAPAGQELIPVDPKSLFVNATFLYEISSSVNREFTEAVINIWPNLTREFNKSAICLECESSFIPAQRPFVIAGGRFREPYYWDSYWILHGLLRSAGSFTEIARNQIENFFDLVDMYGFVPNGARKYYLNRAGPPVLAQMVRVYLEYTNDMSILERGISVLQREHSFFMNNRTIGTTFHKKNYTMNRYNAANNQPRPESYYEDWTQVNNESYYLSDGSVYPARNTSAEEKRWQYINLAAGAESGWDFSSRFMSNPRVATEDTYFPLASYKTVDLIPVDLNSLLYWHEVTVGEFLNMTGRSSEAEVWYRKARDRSQAMYELMWNETLGSYFDFNSTSKDQELFWARDGDALPIETTPAHSNDTQVIFNVAQLMPFWTGAAAPSLKNNPKSVRSAFQRISEYLDIREGGIAPTNFRTSQQWDQPNVWPPHMHILMEALLKTPAINGKDDEDWIWTQNLALRLGQRYLDSAFCTWRATGGSSPSSPPLGNLARDLGGVMFEKYSDQSLNEAGSGGEYEVAVGFGWSNGVLIWVADTFRNQLQTAFCPNLTVNDTGAVTSDKHAQHGDGRGDGIAVGLDQFDASWTSSHVGGLEHDGDGDGVDDDGEGVR